MTEKEAIERIHSVYPTGCKNGLENMRALMGRLGNPQEKLTMVHVAGTNGKGSCCAMIERMLRAAGYKTGLYTSPYIEVYNERIRINGEPIAGDKLAALVESVWPAVEACEKDGVQITEFELGTALAFCCFAKEKVNVAVIEVGLGGRLDPTNIITPAVSVITEVGMDHMQFLGDTIEQIALEKAGIMKPGVPVVLGRQEKAARGVLLAAAKGKELPILSLTAENVREERTRITFDVAFGGERLKALTVSLCGRHQADNACAALGALLALKKKGFKIPTSAVRAGLADVHWPGRLEYFGRVLLDGTDITSTPVSLPSTGSSRTLTFEPSAYGQQVAFTLTVSDAEGRQVSRNLSTYIKPKGELKLSMTAPDGVTAGSRSIFPITVSEENYAGTFRLRLSTATASSVGSFYFQGRQIAPGVPVDFTVAAGTHNVEFAAANAFGGDAALTATVTDDWSESRSVTRTASVSPDIIVLHPKLNVETVREYPIDSLYTMMPYVNLKVVAGQAVPTAVTVTVDVLCTGRYTGYQGGQKTYPVTQSVTIPAGSTVSNVVHLPWPMGTPTYYISDNMPADPGYAYESVSCRPGAITPSSYGSIVFQLNAD